MHSVTLSSLLPRPSGTPPHQTHIKVPDSVVRSLLNSILPRLVRRLLIRAIPTELGMFLKKVRRDIRLSFTVGVAETIPRSVWTAPLFESTEGRTLLGLERREVAVLCSILSRGNVGRTSGLQARSVSVDALYGYLLKYGSSGSTWESLLEIWDERFRTVCPEVTGSGWISSLFKGIHELGRKPLQVEISIVEIDVLVNVQDSIALWSEIFLNKISSMIKRAEQMNLPHINFKSPQEISAAAQELVLAVNSSVALATRSVEHASLIVDLEVLGGSTMKCMLKAASLEVRHFIPQAPAT